jgi:hypothetical protein
MINAMRNFPSGLVRVCLFLIASVLILPSATLGRRAIPEDNLAYPVLLTLGDRVCVLCKHRRRYLPRYSEGCPV